MKKLLFSCVVIVLIMSLIPVAIGCQSMPQAVFEANATSGQASLTVVFTNKTAVAASDNSSVFNWDFGDGNAMNTTMVAESVTHEYTKAGNYTVTLIVSKKDKPAKTSLMTQTITVEHGPVKSVKLTPETVELNIGQSQTFTSEVSDAFDNLISNATLTWQSEAGTVTDGVFTSGSKAGFYPKGVMATAALETFQAEGVASITIKPDPLSSAMLSELKITAGDTKQLQAIANDQYGNPIKDLEATWSMANKDAGSITEKGVYTAPKKVGSYNDAISVEVKQGDKACQAKGKITIVPAALEQIVTAPETIELGMGMAQQYMAVGIDKFGNRISGLSFTWSVSGDAGTITSGGLFTASNKPGTYKESITVKATKDGVTRTATPDVAVEPDRVMFHSNKHDVDKEDYDLYIMNADGTDIKRITTNQNNFTGYDFSPDGRRLIYVELIESTEYVRLANVDGEWEMTLLSGRRANEPSWSPDGQKIAFQSWEHDPSEIYVMDIDGGNFVRLTNNTVYDDYPDWSPDGTKIIYISRQDTAVVNPKIYIMDADGSQKRQITTGYAYDVFPQWSPDGKEILFTSDRTLSAKWGIYIMDGDGKNLRQLYASEDYSSYDACWAPDGSRVVFISNMDNEKYDIYTVNRDGSNLIRITNDSALDFNPTFLPRKQGVLVTEASIIITEIFDTPKLTAEEITAMASNAVVRIETELESAATSGGSGFIIESDGLILTNNHVISDVKKITVYLKDGSSYNGTVEARDMIHDLALVRIEATNLPTLSIGDLSGVNNGQQVMVLGYPLGNKNVSVTSGLVSSIEYDDGRNTTWIQTDSAVNPGNSGGPLMDMQGRVIGIVAAKYFGIGIEGMGLAISSNTVNLYLPGLKAEAKKAK